MRGHFEDDWRRFGLLTISVASLSSVAKDRRRKEAEEGADDRGGKVRVQGL